MMVPKRVGVEQDVPTAQDILNIPKTMSFVDACARLNTLDFEVHYTHIKNAITLFTVRVYGVPECEDEDLPLAVYFFLEEKLNIKASIEMCARINGSNVIGVIFQDIKTRNDVLNRAETLQDPNTRIAPNCCIKWILDNWPEYDGVDQMA